ncbi:MAG: 1-phosphofructokinase family hexose kinase [Roseitalea porphyridii]|uniref:1-phosphofructokinase family hexose kinase n=1 Tax=Roseitalea porphyridii TaxID=1852022 RepID=UPI0032EF3C12
MSEILTITLNPALDVSTSVGTVTPGPKLRCTEPRYDPGGGGVNVSRAIQRLGGVSRAFVALGGETGEAFRAMLDDEKIRTEVFEVAGNTRQSIAVSETSTGNQFRFQLPCPDWPADQTERLLVRLKDQLTANCLAVLSGSIPGGVPEDIVVRLNRMAVGQDARLIVDTSGPALTRAAGNPGPPFFLLRMDGAEAAEVSGQTFANPADLADYGRQLVTRGAADHLVMSMGAKGTVGVSASERFFVSPPKLEAVSAVGAGDSMVGAIALELSRGSSFREAVRHGVAAAGSAVLTPATELCSRRTADEIMTRVVTIEI